MAKKTTNTAKAKTGKTSSKSTGPTTKSQLIATIADKIGMTKKQVSEVFDQLATVAMTDLSKKGPGVFTIPGLAKMTVKVRPARAAKKGTNPFTGQPMTFKAKPATNVVKIRALKAVKDCVK